MPTLYQAGSVKKSSKKPVQTEQTSHTKPMGPLTCFAVNPAGVRFETQLEEENVILFLRQHLVVLVPPLLIGILLLIAPTVLFPFLLRFSPLPFALPVGYLIIGTLFWYLSAAGFLLASFLKWYFNIYIVTNERVVDIDFVHLLYKEFSETNLGSIQDISYRSGGLSEAFFNYGDVFIQTAGERPNFEFTAVPNPNRVVETISQLMKEHTI